MQIGTVYGAINAHAIEFRIYFSRSVVWKYFETFWSLTKGKGFGNYSFKERQGVKKCLIFGDVIFDWPLIYEYFLLLNSCFQILELIIWNFLTQRFFNPTCPNPGRREKIKLNFYFYTSLWCLKRFYEGLKGLHKTFWGTTKKCENKSLT